MSTTAILNTQFGIPDALTFENGPNDFIIATLTTASATATIALEGAQVLSYKPIGQPPVLFLSRQASYTKGKSLRGGVPVCWPWFAGVRDNPMKPFHGFGRMLRWDVRAAQFESETVTLELGLRESEDTKRYWPYDFDLRLLVTVGPQLRIDLIARNTDTSAFEVTAALHTYFHVGDIDQVTIYGLEDTTYSDKMDEGAEKGQHGSVKITEQTDRIYLNTAATCQIDDPSLNRRIVVAKEGSNTTVVWNPWAAEAKNIADLADEEYQTMVCVETTNAASDTITLPPGEEHRLSAIIHTEPRQQ